MAQRKPKVKEEPRCTPEELENIITFPSGGLGMLPSDDLNEVWPGIYIGEESSARNTIQLKRLGITHVLNAALGKTDYHVNTNHVYYRKAEITWKGIKATDMMNFDLTPFFGETTQFIQEALDSGGKVLVHCVQGVSRSATVVLAYLMTSHHLTSQDAVRTVREKREIYPNPGFLQQLCDFNETLWKKGHFEKRSEEKDMGPDSNTVDKSGDQSEASGNT